MIDKIDEFFNLNVEEFQQVNQESHTSNENTTPIEIHPARDNPQPDEITVRKKVSDTTQNKKHRDAKKSSLTKLLALITAIASVVTVTVVNNKGLNVDFLAVTASATAILYEIDVGDTNEELWLSLTNDFTSRRTLLTSGKNEGTFGNLSPDMKYTLSVHKASSTNAKIKTTSVRTLKNELTNQFIGFNTTPAEDTEGTFSFTANFKNPQNTWMNVSVSLYDSAKIISEDDTRAITVEDVQPNKQYDLSIKDTLFFSSKGTLVAYADVLKPNGEIKNEIIYSQSVDILEKNTYLFETEIHTASYYDDVVYIYFYFVDENELWTYGNLTALCYCDEFIEPYSETILISGDYLYFHFSKEFFSGNEALVELILDITIDDVNYSVNLYSQFNVIKSEDFNENYNPSTTDTTNI